MLADILMWLEDNLLIAGAALAGFVVLVVVVRILKKRGSQKGAASSAFVDSDTYDELAEPCEDEGPLLHPDFPDYGVGVPGTSGNGGQAGAASADAAGGVALTGYANANAHTAGAITTGAGLTGSASSPAAEASSAGATEHQPHVSLPEFDPIKNAADARKLLHSIQGDPPRKRFSFLYIIGMALVAIMLLLLPLIYLGFVSGLGWMVYKFATEQRGILSAQGPMILKLFMYLTPIIVGGVCVLFLLKPFFARSQKLVAPVELKEQDQPLLFAFVRELCLTLKAPMPKRIIVLCDANASASFRHGLWSLFRPGDLQLHIGLKLVKGMDLQSFAGVLAHEFGHFTQGAAMRLNAVIGAINRWFARLVYEKDSWDVALDGMIEDSPSFFPFVFLLAKWAVGIGRGLLWVLLHVAHAISCLLMRQQEYDADAYETYIAGSRKFAHTTHQLAALSIVSNYSLEPLNEGLRRMVLPRDYIDLFMRFYTNMPKEFFEDIPKIVAEEKSGWFRTHPTSLERIGRAQKRDLKGIFHPPLAPASVLFRNLDKMCEDATLHLYRHSLGRLVDKRITRPTEEFVEALKRPAGIAR